VLRRVWKGVGDDARVFHGSSADGVTWAREALIGGSVSHGLTLAAAGCIRYGNVLALIPTFPSVAAKTGRTSPNILYRTMRMTGSPALSGLSRRSVMSAGPHQMEDSDAALR
jgi:hypothetical protein